jgi:pimeloyl-ACP methyl ester carboxylesterase
VRARQPDAEGHVQCDGVKIGYEVFGDGTPALLLMPAWTIIHSRFWKLQVPYLAEHFRVITFDRPGNGRSDRALDPEAYGVATVAGQALAVMDATGTDRAVLVSLSQGAQEVLMLAADHTDRVLGAVVISPALMLEPDHPERAAAAERFLDPYPADPKHWERLNAQYWLDHYEDFADFFFTECSPEPHSTSVVASAAATSVVGAAAASTTR